MIDQVRSRQLPHAAQSQAPNTRMQSALVVAVRLYQRVLSPLVGNCCRFDPSCSHYAVAAICTHGCGWGLWLTARRLLRCNPLFDGGHDPVPANVSLFSSK
jgi:putative membrane protein insertion efficiency factor